MSQKRQKKLQFEVQENETIDACLTRMKQLGYIPIRRLEKPIFQEIKKGNETIFEPIGRQIVFEGRFNE
ncbi:NETI motif-containing protein [Bacillus salipaludis]|uniref:NETI motif-containing protein n=1 Tax=Bacillus salipaludis TaxID=2547811 RepID=UPI003D247742